MWDTLTWLVTFSLPNTPVWACEDMDNSMYKLQRATSTMLSCTHTMEMILWSMIFFRLEGREKHGVNQKERNLKINIVQYKWTLPSYAKNGFISLANTSNHSPEGRCHWASRTLHGCGHSWQGESLTQAPTQSPPPAHNIAKRWSVYNSTKLDSFS